VRKEVAQAERASSLESRKLQKIRDFFSKEENCLKKTLVCSLGRLLSSLSEKKKRARTVDASVDLWPNHADVDL
jgi:hypothetical protein